MNKNCQKKNYFSYAKSRWGIYCLLSNSPDILFKMLLIIFTSKGRLDVKDGFQESNCVFWGPDFQEFRDQNGFSFFTEQSWIKS